MKKGRFNEEQMVGMLREADRSSVAEVAKKHGVSEQTLYNWRKHFAGHDRHPMSRLEAMLSSRPAVPPRVGHASPIRFIDALISEFRRRDSSRSVCLCPPFQAFLEARVFPSAVRGPVDRSHGFHALTSSACRFRRSCVQPFTV